MKMTFDTLQDKLMPVLEEVLALRLVHSRNWDNVSISTGKRYMDICWCSAKNGKDTTQTKRVAPFNAETLCQELATQFTKLQEESK